MADLMAAVNENDDENNGDKPVPAIGDDKYEFCIFTSKHRKKHAF